MSHLEIRGDGGASDLRARNEHEVGLSKSARDATVINVIDCNATASDKC